jgi:sugar O-acyltransferase (sialic acid O-acetyltransferase NeuD family)
MVVADAARLGHEYEIAGFIDDVLPERRGEQFCGAPILGGREQLDLLPARGISKLIFGFGDCRARLELAELVRAKGLQIATVVHPRACVATDVLIGSGTVILAGAIVNPAAHIGENVIVNTSASIDHECVIDDGAHICPGVHLGGKVSVGRMTWVGIGAAVRDHVNIGAGTVVGAGAVVVEDIPDGVIAYGIPARVIRKIETDR